MLQIQIGDAKRAWRSQQLSEFRLSTAEFDFAIDGGHQPVRRRRLSIVSGNSNSVKFV